jgi:hypothetical protein
VLHLQPLIYERWAQALEVTFWEVMPGGEPPLLKRRKELTRAQAIKLWAAETLRVSGWPSCASAAVVAERFSGAAP